jgi:hypothetical protein
MVTQRLTRALLSESCTNTSLPNSWSLFQDLHTLFLLFVVQQLSSVRVVACEMLFQMTVKAVVSGTDIWTGVWS